MAAAHVVTALQAIAARETDPLSSAVVSVTMFHAGDAYNVIPQGARIGGTLRSLSTEGLRSLRDIGWSTQQRVVLEVVQSFRH